jgi:aspartokinase/homoserine dehydrogenase 1
LPFGHGLVGGTLINQIRVSCCNRKRKDIKLNVLLLPILKKCCLIKKELMQTEKKTLMELFTLNDIISTTEHHLENLIAIDNTASATL